VSEGDANTAVLHTCTEQVCDDLRPAYLRFDDFLAVRDTLDPQRGFGNE